MGWLKRSTAPDIGSATIRPSGCFQPAGRTYLLARTLVAIGIFAVLALVAGAAFGATWGWGLLSLLLGALVLHHALHLRTLEHWAAGPPSETVPEGEGWWRNAFTLIYQRQRAEIRTRRRLARALARSRQAGRALPYGVVILDADFRILWCNDTSEAHFSLSGEQDRNQPILNLARQPELAEYAAARDFSAPLELRTARSDGLILSVQFVPYEESQWLMLSRDVTQAARLEAVRRDFVANVSHELRTPLTVLVGFLETLRERKADPERAERFIRLMEDQGARMQRILDDLLALSTLESAPDPPGDERVAVGGLLSRIRSEAEGLSGGRHRVVLDETPGYDLLGADAELASAFGNLASNAVRYTPPGGEVRLVWRAGPGGAVFSVEDTGIGIEREHIPRLTERFYRVDRGRSRDTGGTGLGLAIVKHTLSRHQASLEIESEPGKGSRFIARFPARRVVPAAAIAVA
jgi:two-component system phosphate regulon sensor histidine kinase PhoR